mmetsp:Transcript_2643/g.8450  ORF Transcript_2643/g.8450 Transcript_2643/m.8450 type:complete len:94 (-) Transcript_2643:139-420(-)
MPQTPTSWRKTKKNRFYDGDVNDDEENGDQNFHHYQRLKKTSITRRRTLSLSLIFRKEETKTKSLGALSDFSVLVQNRFLCSQREDLYSSCTS